MIRIRLDNINPFLYQWDTGQYLIVNGIRHLTYIYLAYEKETQGVRLGPYQEKESRVKIPDSFLQKDKIINVYVVETEDSKTNTTRLVFSFPVKFRPKPDDYTVEEDDILSWHELEYRIDQLEKKFQENETYVYKQTVSSSSWTIKHNLSRYPSVTIVDSAKTVVIGEVTYIDENNLTVNFSSGFCGTAYLN